MKLINSLLALTNDAAPGSARSQDVAVSGTTASFDAALAGLLQQLGESGASGKLPATSAGTVPLALAELPTQPRPGDGRSVDIARRIRSLIQQLRRENGAVSEEQLPHLPGEARAAGEHPVGSFDLMTEAAVSKTTAASSNESSGTSNPETANRPQAAPRSTGRTDAAPSPGAAISPGTGPHAPANSDGQRRAAAAPDPNTAADGTTPRPTSRGRETRHTESAPAARSRPTTIPSPRGAAKGSPTRTLSERPDVETSAKSSNRPNGSTSYQKPARPVSPGETARARSESPKASPPPRHAEQSTSTPSRQFVRRGDASSRPAEARSDRPIERTAARSSAPARSDRPDRTGPNRPGAAPKNVNPANGASPTSSRPAVHGSSKNNSSSGTPETTVPTTTSSNTPGQQTRGSRPTRSAAAPAVDKTSNKASGHRRDGGRSGADTGRTGVAATTGTTASASDDARPRTSAPTTRTASSDTSSKASAEAPASGRDHPSGDHDPAGGQNERSGRQDGHHTKENAGTASTSEAGAGSSRSRSADGNREFARTIDSALDRGIAEKPSVSRDSSSPTHSKTGSDASPARSGRSGESFVSGAWRRAIHNGGARSYRLENGWHVLTMELDDEDGKMTVKTRAGDEKVSVSVGMSDPKLRSLVAANTDRLQAALRAEYESDIDFSLSGDEGQSAGDADGNQSSDRGSDRRRFGGTPAQAGDKESSHDDRRALYGSFEWIG